MCSYQHCNNLAWYTSVTALTTKSGGYSLSRRFLFNDELKEVIPRRQRCLLTVTGRQGGTTPIPRHPCRSAQKPEVDAILGEPQARKTAWGFRFGQSDNAHIVSVEARTIASICPRRGKPRGGPAEDRQSLRPAHVFGNLVAFQFFSAAQLPGFEK